jgi:5-hydroxyisourate hydrolase
MSYLSAHVLDAAAGRPASGVAVRLETASGEVLGTATTDADGRVGDLGPDTLDAGTYRVVFGSGDYFAATGTPSFHPEIAVTFRTETDQAHYHIPLLLSPYAYTTYRGS